MFQWMITHVLNVTCLLICACCADSWRQSCNISFPFTQLFPLASTNLYFPPSSTFFLFCCTFVFPSPPHPSPQKLSVCPRGQAPSQKLAQSLQHLPLPWKQTLLFRSQREGPGISRSNITSNSNSQTFSLMTSGNPGALSQCTCEPLQYIELFLHNLEEETFFSPPLLLRKD